MNNAKNYTQKHKGINFSSPTKDGLLAMIKDSDFRRSIFQRNSGHGSSSYARLLNDGTVEYVFSHHKSENRVVTLFDSKADFYNQK